MSIWTHVNGSIRIDSFRSNKSNEIERLKEILGHINYYYGEWDDYTKLPCGSEGSLEYEIIENKDSSCLDSYTIVITGNLRCYERFDEIEKWFRNVFEEIENSFCGIRMCILEVTGGLEEKDLILRGKRVYKDDFTTELKIQKLEV